MSQDAIFARRASITRLWLAYNPKTPADAPWVNLVENEVQQWTPAELDALVSEVIAYDVQLTNAVAQIGFAARRMRGRMPTTDTLAFLATEQERKDYRAGRRRPDLMTPDEIAEKCRYLRAKGDAANAKEGGMAARPPAPRDFEGWSRHCRERMGLESAPASAEPLQLPASGPERRPAGVGMAGETTDPSGSILSRPEPSYGHSDISECEGEEGYENYTDPI